MNDGFCYSSAVLWKTEWYQFKTLIALFSVNL
jgi:hypothetical protein